MPERKITFIIGAGASAEANLPTGEELKEQIAKNLQANYVENGIDFGVRPEIGAALNEHVYKEFVNLNISKYIVAGNEIHNALPLARSIDHFIHSRKGNKELEFMGKLGIALSILEAESTKFSLVSSDHHHPPNFKVFKETWYNKFMQLIGTYTDVDGFKERLSSISLIIFNYDRCVEHYLYHAFQTLYGITVNESAGLINDMDIFHPYGVVGKLPWQTDAGLSSIEFGSDTRANQLLDAAKNIKTFTEGTDPTSNVARSIRDEMLNAKIIVFLGFGFLDLNMDLLAPESGNSELTNEDEQKMVLATAYNMSNENKLDVQRSIRNRLPVPENNITIDNLVTCSDLFDKYERLLGRGLS